MNRRQLLRTTGLGLVGGAVAQARVLPTPAADAKRQPCALSLAEYERAELLEPRHMRESLICDCRIRQGQGLKLFKLPNVSQALLCQWATRKIQIR